MPTYIIADAIYPDAVDAVVQARYQDARYMAQALAQSDRRSKRLTTDSGKCLDIIKYKR
jgi:hypothetical protein